MAETTITYNGVTIKNVLTEEISQEVVLDSSGVNPIYVRVHASFVGIVHMVSPGYTNKIGLQGQLYAATLADSHNLFIDNLMQPGRNFQMLVGGASFFDVMPGYVRPGLPIPQEGNSIRRRDVNHGPLTSVRILEITSANTMKIHFTITMHLPYTDAGGQVPGGAISFRFWISEDIDCDDWTTERTYHGTLRVRHLGHNVLTELRNNFTMPPLVEGFVRKRISLSQRPNGLELDFTITDKEVWATPPFPAASWEGHQTLFTPRPGGFLLGSEVFVRLNGDKDTPKLGLLQLAQKIIDTKLHRIDISQEKQTILRSLIVKDNFSKNSVEMHATIDLVGKERMLWNLESGNFGRPMNVGSNGAASELPTYNKEKIRAIYPTACIKGLFLATLQDPLHVYGFPNTNENARQLTYEIVDCPHPEPTQPLPPYAANISEEQVKSAYNVYRMTSQTDKQWGTIQLPYGKSSNSSGATTAVLLSMHKPIAGLRVRIEAERLHTWPTLPSAQEYLKLGAVFAPVRTVVTPSAPITSADSKKSLFHSTIDYYFVQDKEASGIPAGLMPYRRENNEDVFVVPTTAFQSNQIIFN